MANMNVNTAYSVKKTAAPAMTEAEIAREIKKLGMDISKMERQKVKLPRNYENPEDNVVEVGLNGVFFRIKREETVELPVVIIEILEHANIL